MPSQPISTTRDLQQIPTAFADRLEEMYRNGDTRVNAVLGEARRLGWHASTLGAVIGVSAAAASKRMERATPPPWPLNMRDMARITERELSDIVTKHGVPGDDLALLAGVEDDINYLLEARPGEGTATREDVAAVAAAAVEKFGQLSEKAATPRAARRWRTLRARTAEAITYEPGEAPPVVAVSADEAWREMTRPAVAVARDIPLWLADRYPELPRASYADVEATLELLHGALDGAQVGDSEVFEDVDAQRQLADDAATAMLRIKAELPVSNNRLAAVRKLTRAAARLRMCAEFTPAGVEVEGVLIPLPPRTQRTQHGRSLPDDEVARLQELQRMARRVNGTTKADSPEWAASMELSELLYALMHPSDGSRPYPAYYLAKVLGVTHRAVVARMERLEVIRARAAQQSAELPDQHADAA